MINKNLEKLIDLSKKSYCYRDHKKRFSAPSLIRLMCVGSLVRHARNVTMRALGQRAKAMESLAKIKKEHL